MEIYCTLVRELPKEDPLAMPMYAIATLPLIASKTWLITKSDFISTATTLFQDTEVRITTEGRPYLGSPIGTEEFIRSYTSAKV